jgi:hypothetical protein
MGISYFYNSDLRRFKNGTALYFNSDMMPGEIHLMTGDLVFPDGTEMHGYECVCDEGAPDTNVYSAGGIRYPDGREVENPSADEIGALFLKDGAEIELLPKRMRWQLAVRGRKRRMPGAWSCGRSARRMAVFR